MRGIKVETRINRLFFIWYGLLIATFREISGGTIPYTETFQVKGMTGYIGYLYPRIADSYSMSLKYRLYAQPCFFTACLLLRSNFPASFMLGRDTFASADSFSISSNWTPRVTVADRIQTPIWGHPGMSMNNKVV